MAQAKYFSTFSLVEVQQTFYQPPLIATLEKWRMAAPPDFEFAMKAWQLITHNASSPTYRRLKKELNAKESRESGDFKTTKIVREAYSTTIECAKALRATKILFQCPASFTPSKQNSDNMRKFFEVAERPAGIDFYWEPRGDWQYDLIAELCHELNLIHVVDPFVSKPVASDKIYFRLHGVGGWRHVFTDAELQFLWHSIPAGEQAHVLFNNTKMINDALRFRKIVNDVVQ